MGDMHKIWRLLVVLIAVSATAQTSLKGTSSLKGSVSMSGILANDYPQVITGVNVPGGLSSLLSANDVTTAVLPENFDSSIRHAPPRDTAGRGICASGGTCDVADGPFRDSLSPFAANVNSLALTLPSGAAPDAGDFHTNFSNDYSVQFDNTPGNNEFFVQYRVEVDPAMLDAANWPGSGGFKTSIFSEGDRSGYTAGSCSNQPSEIVTVQYIQACQPNSLTMYSSCGFNEHPDLFLGAGYGLETLTQPVIGCPYYGDRGVSCAASHCFVMAGSEFMTIQIHGKANTWGAFDSVMEQWAAHQNQPSQLIQNSVDWKYRNANPGVSGWGKIWLSPYMTGVTSAATSASMRFDNLIVSRRRIPDPGTGVPNAPDSLSLAIIDTTHITVSWRVNSQNGTAQDDTGFKVLRCQGNQIDCFATQAFSVVGTTAAGATSFADSGLTHTLPYTYMVYGINGAGNSANAASLCLNTSANPCGGTATP
jgi:hypothetical protein